MKTQNQDRSELQDIDSILADLESKHSDFETFEKEHPLVTNKRRDWMVEYNLDAYNVLRPGGSPQHEKYRAEWQSREPGLAEIQEVANARKRVADAESELALAKSELIEIESNGTPLSRYIKNLARAESMVVSLAQALANQARRELLLEAFGHADEWRLSKEATDHINMQPKVTRFANYRFRGVIAAGGSGNEALTAVQLEHARERVVDALSQLREMAI
jgi:hypothetical protein